MSSSLFVFRQRKYDFLRFEIIGVPYLKPDDHRLHLACDHMRMLHHRSLEVTQKVVYNKL